RHRRDSQTPRRGGADGSGAYLHVHARRAEAGRADHHVAVPRLVPRRCGRAGPLHHVCARGRALKASAAKTGSSGREAFLSKTLFPRPGSAAEAEEGRTLAPKFDADGLVTCVATDAASGDVLMVAHMNAEALARTIETGEAWYFSRSRQ